MLDERRWLVDSSSSGGGPLIEKPGRRDDQSVWSEQSTAGPSARQSGCPEAGRLWLHPPHQRAMAGGHGRGAVEDDDLTANRGGTVMDVLDESPLGREGSGQRFVFRGMQMTERR